MNTVQRLVNYFKAGFPCLALTTTEEKRAQADIIAAAKVVDKKIITWSCVEGTVSLDGNLKREDDKQDPLYAIEFLLKNIQEETIVILRDIHDWLRSSGSAHALLTRHLRELIQDYTSYGSCVVIVAPEFKPYPAIDHLVTIVNYELPTEEVLREIAVGIANSKQDDVVRQKCLDLLKSHKGNEIIKALRGLYTTEAENALSLSLVEKETFDTEVIYREKMNAIKKSDLLTLTDPDPAGLDAIGGLEALKEWIIERKETMSVEAIEYGVDAPKGVFVTGVPGTGKSLTATVIGTAFNIPCVKLDGSKLFNKYVGESQQRTRDALALAEALSPCVLYIDEIDKALAGGKGDGSDGGSAVTQQVNGVLLPWLQDRNNRPNPPLVFVVATSNKVTGLDPALFRHGRFDDMFSVDLPHQVEREQIAAVILKRAKRNPENFDLTAIANATKDYTGAEIGDVIKEAKIIGFRNKREFTTEDIVVAAAKIIPQIKTAPEEIEAIRRWGEGKARPASKAISTTKPTTTRKLK